MWSPTWFKLLVELSRNSHDNLSTGENMALQHIRNNQEIIIKPADKGNAVVVMDKSAYIQESERQLEDDRFILN